MTQTQDEQKRAAAQAALAFVEEGRLLGVGTGSTVNFFIEALGRAGTRVSGCVASSVATAERLRALGLPVVPLTADVELPLYVDGADEIDPAFRMIKGGGGALTREKIVASAARRFVCVVDQSKDKPRLGDFALPVEVLPFARGYVERRLRELGGVPSVRAGVTTDNGNELLSVPGLDFADPIALERELAVIPGVVESGVFALRPADVVLIATPGGVVTRTR